MTDGGGTDPTEPPTADPGAIAPVTEPAIPAGPGFERSAAVGAAPSAAAVFAPDDPLVHLPQRGGRLLGASFDVLTTARADLRQASLYIGVILLLGVGPLAFLLLGLATEHVGLGNIFFADAIPRRFADTVNVTLTVTFVLAAVGYIVVLIEGQAVAIILLAGRLAHRPITLRAAIVRSRVVFWRIFRGALLIGIPLTALQLAVQYPLTDGLSNPSQGASLLGTAVSTVAGWPFVYLGTGIVLGDVQATESARRSTRLVRARPWTALAIAVFAAIAGYLTSFGIGAADDVVQRLVTSLGLDISAGGASLLAGTALVLVLVFAFGTLQFTVTAITIAPQVVAFLALTRHTGGIDQALAADAGRLAPSEAPTLVPVERVAFRWIPRRYLVASALGVFLALLTLIKIDAG